MSLRGHITQIITSYFGSLLSKQDNAPPFDSSAPLPENKNSLHEAGVFILVEMGGIEPPCKKDSAGLLRSVVRFVCLNSTEYEANEIAVESKF